MVAPGQRDGSQNFAEQSRWWRWGAAVATVLVGLAVFLVNADLLQTCGQEVVGEGAVARVVEVCKAPGVTDFQIVALVLLVGLLVLPDFSEIGVGQLLTLKKKVADQEATLADQATKQHALSGQLADLRVSVADARAAAVSDSRANANVQVTFDGGRYNLDEVMQGVTAKLSSLEDRIAGAPATRPAAARTPRILWVDDKPGNNVVEAEAMRTRGYRIRLARSTAEGLQIYDEEGPFDAVITDLGRTEDGRYVRDAGIELIQALRPKAPRTPLFLYSRVAQRSPQDPRIAEVTALPGVQVTVSPLSDVAKALREAE